MSFSTDVTVGEQRAVIKVPDKGLTKKGKEVALEGFRAELADPADADKFTFEAHEDGTPSKIVAVLNPDFVFPVTDPVTTSLPVAVNVFADGRPGEGVKEISDSGVLVIKSPDAATFSGAVEVTTEDLPSA